MIEFGEVITAMVTPFDHDLKVDFNLAHKLMEHLVANGSDGILLSGTTGESPTLSDEEKLKLFHFGQKNFSSKVKIIAGTGSNDTRHSVLLSKQAEDMGVDALLIVTPYYNKPSQEGLYRHFEAIASSVNLPIIIYNVPSRTGVNITAGTCLKLSEINNIAAVKEASGNLAQISEIAKGAREDFLIYSGNDSDTLPILSVGGYGVISVASHLMGKEIKQMINAYKSTDVKKAKAINSYLLDLFNAIFITTNPVPIKEALNMIGLKVGGVRLPLCQMSDNERKTLIKIVQNYKTVV